MPHCSYYFVHVTTYVELCNLCIFHPFEQREKVVTLVNVPVTCSLLFIIEFDNIFLLFFVFNPESCSITAVLMING